jgi:hypothetical protein
VEALPWARRGWERGRSAGDDAGSPSAATT